MNNDNPQLMKELQHPTAKYDYDGITGTWLLIPAKFHILMLAIALPIILWMFPFIHLKGNYRYVFADYRYYIAGAVTIFCLASTFLSIIKAKQVKYRIRPMSHVNRQGVTKSKNSRTKNSVEVVEKHPKVHVGHLTNKRQAISPTTAKKQSSSQDKVANIITNNIVKTADKNKTSATAKSQGRARSSSAPISAKQPNTPSQKSLKAASDQKLAKKPKKSKQMQLDL